MLLNLTVANISTGVAAADFEAAIAAIARQVTEHFLPEWGATANLSGIAASRADPNAPIPGNHDAIIYLGDRSNDPTNGVDDVLGYHSTNYALLPYGFVYLDICTKYGDKWTSTLSHEVLELLADPTAVLSVAGSAPNGAQGTVQYDLEVCDPTEGDTYEIDTVTVSNFVGRSYFGMVGGSGNTNYLKLDLAAFGVRPKGYLQYEDGSDTHQILGARVTKRKLAAKKLLKSGRRNERRRLRLIRAAVS